MIKDHQLQWLARNSRRFGRYYRVGDIAERISETLNRSKNPKLDLARQQWEELAGSELAGLSFPSAVNNGILHVSVNSPSAKFMIEQFHRSTLIDELRTRTKLRIRDIKCVLDTSR